MVRPQKERRVEQLPPVTSYKPAGIPLRSVEEIVLTIEEMEAIRLSDVEQLDQTGAAGRMEISAPTFNRILNGAHRKIATALWQGYALRIDGGNFRVAHQCKQGPRYFICHECEHSWSLPHGTGQSAKDLNCPSCQTANISRDHTKS
ncbi:hypothetical protein SDC9_80781 [bioreactor metagenome]|uniref:Uncharacterized protein n=1 Tax=bioreactor metagenome TaxID=1076179 RepID=A0A644Z0W9_9ZZZZ